MRLGRLPEAMFQVTFPRETEERAPRLVADVVASVLPEIAGSSPGAVSISAALDPDQWVIVDIEMAALRLANLRLQKTPCWRARHAFETCCAECFAPLALVATAHLKAVFDTYPNLPEPVTELLGDGLAIRIWYYLAPAPVWAGPSRRCAATLVAPEYHRRYCPADLEPVATAVTLTTTPVLLPLSLHPHGAPASRLWDNHDGGAPTWPRTDRTMEDAARIITRLWAGHVSTKSE